MKLDAAQWQQLYALLQEPMIDFDCGTLCAPGNGGIPVCCDEKLTKPVLFRGELTWHQQTSDFWQPVTESEELGPEEVYASCPGCNKCDRSLRALVCRTYPFEPFLDEEGALLGLTFNYYEAGRCPLLVKKDLVLNPQYILNSLLFWDFVFQHDEEQYELYMDNSDDLREAQENGQVIRLFTPNEPGGAELVAH